MVSLDNAVLARWEYGGKRYEILVDPDLVDNFRSDPSSVNIDDFLATDEVGMMLGAETDQQKKQLTLLLRHRILP